MRTTEGHEREYEILNDFLNNSTNIATDVLCESNHVNSSNNECSSQIESLNEMYKLLHVLGSRTDSSDPKQSKCSNFINYTEELIFDAIDDIYDESNEDGIDINIAQNLSQFFSQKKFKRSIYLYKILYKQYNSEESSNIQSDRLHRVFNAKSYSSNFDRISLSTSAVSLELDSRNKISELEIPNENILQEFCQRFVKNQNIKKSTHDSTKGYENKKNKLCITASDKDIPIPKSDLKASVRNSNLRYKALVHNKKALSDDEDDGSGNSDYYNRKHGLGRWRSTFIRTKQLKQNAKQQKMNIDEIESSYIDQEDLHVNRKTRNAENNDRSLKRKSKINIFNPPSAISKQKIIETSSFRTALDELTSNDDLDLKRDENKTNVESCSKPNPSTMSAKSIVKKFQSPMAKIDEEKTLGDENKSDKNSITSNLEIFKGIDQHLIDIIISEIVDDGPKIAFEDIAGLEFAKKTIKEIVIWPMLRPDIFTGLRGPPRGLLLFGPPGTGKTLIGKCIATSSNSTFFSISASSLTSKWIGESEKLVRALFTVARSKPPAVIFVDEIDSLLTQRSENEHESSRRIKTEFLVQLDGVSVKSNECNQVLIVGATNRPQEIDEAARRRFTKRLFIPLPDAIARKDQIIRMLKDQNHDLSCHQIDSIVDLTDGYSGADLKCLCQEAAMGAIRELEGDLNDIQCNDLRAISIIDFKSALTHVKPSVSNKDIEICSNWNKEFGSYQI